MSYRKKHISKSIHKAKPKKSLFKNLWFWISILAAILAGTAVYFLFFYEGFQIKDFVVSGNQDVSTADIRTLAQKDSDQPLFEMGPISLSSKSIFFFDPKPLQEDLLASSAKLSSVSVTRRFPATLVISVKERAGEAIYCATNQQCFYIDEDGIIFQDAAGVQNGMTMITKDLPGPTELGGNPISRSIMSDIMAVQDDLNQKFQIGVAEAVVHDPLRLDVVTSENWQIYFDLSQDSDIQAQLIKLNLLLEGDLSADARRNLQYVDVRFRDRAYYK